MKIRKAVITAAARGARLYPVADTVQKAMLPMVDSDGLYKPMIQIIAEEAIASGIEEICIVCAPGDEARYLSNFNSLRTNLLEVQKEIDGAAEQATRIQNLLDRLHFTIQEDAHGYGDAVHCSKKFVGDEPFLLMLGDYLYVSNLAGKRCAQQLIELASKEECSVSAVNPTPEHLVNRYGTLTGKAVLNHKGVYQIEKIIEKPSVSLAETELQTPGLRAGYYLCFFGMHVFTPSVFSVLEKQRKLLVGSKHLPLTPSLQEISETSKFLALEMKGNRYDTGKMFGLTRAQLALGLSGSSRDVMLNSIIQVMAESEKQK